MLTLRLPPEPASASRARQVTREHLSAVCPPATIDTAALLVTELVSNVVLHAATDMLLVLDVVPGQVDLKVQDGSLASPRLRDVEPDAPNGRGLAIVDQLATRWGVDRQEGRKVVWATIEFTPIPDAMEPVSEV